MKRTQLLLATTKVPCWKFVESDERVIKNENHAARAERERERGDGGRERERVQQTETAMFAMKKTTALKRGAD